MSTSQHAIIYSRGRDAVPPHLLSVVVNCVLIMILIVRGITISDPLPLSGSEQEAVQLLIRATRQLLISTYLELVLHLLNYCLDY